MNPFRKKIILDPLYKKETSRRSFIHKTLAGLFGAVILTSANEVYALESKTDKFFVKQNGEVIPDYWPQSSVPFVGEINVFPYNFAPSGWAFCDGQLLPIAQYNALYSVLGTTFGGNGRNTFGLPDFRGRVPTGIDDNFPYPLGTAEGEESITLTQSQMPAHNHQVKAFGSGGDLNSPAGAFVSTDKSAEPFYIDKSNTYLYPSAVASAGAGNPVAIRQPYLGLSFCISLQGVLPPRP